MLSIIIPTLDEERHLPRLLESIRKQHFNSYEIIVADGFSKDNTRKIAKKYRCKIIKGGKQSVGLNNGAKAAKYKTLLILDADSSLPINFLNKNFNKFKQKNLDIASCYIEARNGNILDDVSHLITNLYYISTKNFRPFVPSFCFFVKKEFFFEVGGFDEKVPWFIDLAFSNSLPRRFKYDILPVKIKLSVRMAKRLGRFKQARVLILTALFRLIKKNYYAKYEY